MGKWPAASFQICYSLDTLASAISSKHTNVVRLTGAAVGLFNSKKSQPINKNKNRSPSLESLNLALSDTPQAGLVTIVNKSHFRSNPDNRIEGERITPNLMAAAPEK